MHHGVGDEGLIGSVDYLKNHYQNLNIDIIPERTCEEEGLPNLRNMNSIIATCNDIAAREYAVLQQGMTPLFIAGDHSAAMGSVSASSTYLHDTTGEDMGLIWIDAHPDINTSDTTVTGNIHGMPVAALLGKGEAALTRFLSERPKLKPEHIVMLGLRDIDPPEARLLSELSIKHYTCREIRYYGLTSCLRQSSDYLSGLAGVHLSFDLDSMDPQIIPGVSVPAANGLMREDVAQIVQTFSKQLPIIAYDIVEFNHAHDIDDQTADYVSQLVDMVMGC